MQQITDLELYLLDMVNEKYIDLSNSFIGDNGEIFLKINISSLPMPTGTGYSTAENLLNALYYHSKDIYVVCNFEGTPIDIKAKLKLSDMEKYVGIIYEPDVITSTFIQLEQLKHSERYKYIEQIKTFKEFVEEFIKLQIRKNLFSNTIGDFIVDQVQHNTYLQKRNLNGDAILYMICDWWEYFQDNTVNWIDVDNGLGKTFAALKN